MAIDVHSASHRRLRRPTLRLFRRARERAAADRWIAERRHAFNPNEAVHRRIAELTTPRERRLLARSLRGAVNDAGRTGLSASPLNRRAVAECTEALVALADRLADLDRPVAPRGVVLAARLLTDGGSPLYGRGNSRELRQHVAVIRAALDDA